jgi:hypothetical protein
MVTMFFTSAVGDTVTGAGGKLYIHEADDVMA